MATKKGGCLKFLLLASLVSLAVLWLAAEAFFNVGSNLVALSVRHSKESLQVQTRKTGWKTVTALTPGDLGRAMTVRHSEPGLKWSTLKVRRRAGFGWSQRVWTSRASQSEVFTPSAAANCGLFLFFCTLSF